MISKIQIQVFWYITPHRW